MIDGHQAEHEELARKSDKALSDSQRLQIERDRYKELWEKADVAAKQLHAELTDRLTKGVQQSLPAEVAGGEVQITPDGKISIAGDVLFSPGSADLTAKAKAILGKLAPMLKNDFKLEVEALISKDISYVTETYVPERLEDQDFLD